MYGENPITFSSCGHDGEWTYLWLFLAAIGAQNRQRLAKLQIGEMGGFNLCQSVINGVLVDLEVYFPVEWLPDLVITPARELGPFNAALKLLSSSECPNLKTFTLVCDARSSSWRDIGPGKLHDFTWSNLEFIRDKHSVKNVVVDVVGSLSEKGFKEIRDRKVNFQGWSFIVHQVTL
jgi:hypothetical protein